MREDARPAVEWPTFLLVVGCHALWALATMEVAGWSMPLAWGVTVLTITLHSSLQHEVLHGHPFRHRLANEALVFLPLGLVFPYARFRDLHLAHHFDECLTDPYDDPESNFVDPQVWVRLPRPIKWLLRANNTLAGRMLLGPAIGIAAFVAGDLRAIRAGNRAVMAAWALHVAGVLPVLGWVAMSPMPLWVYLTACYAGMSVLKIRTYLEHRAHEKARGRTVLIERGGILPFLFLNNNLHAVHHAKPNLAWYRLPALYAAQRADYLRRNEHYVYGSYWEVFRAHFVKAKDPVPHPLYPAFRGSARRAGVAEVADERVDSLHTGGGADADDALRAAKAAERDGIVVGGGDLRTVSLRGAGGLADRGGDVALDRGGAAEA